MKIKGRKRGNCIRNPPPINRFSNGPARTVIWLIIMIIIVSFAMNMFTQNALNVAGSTLLIITNDYMSTLVSVFCIAPRVDCLCKQCHAMKWAHPSDVTFLLRGFLNTVCSNLKMSVS